jgi:hypothetical protein
MNITDNPHLLKNAVRRSILRPDIENWGLGTYLYAFLLWWIIIVGLINLAIYFLS